MHVVYSSELSFAALEAGGMNWKQSCTAVCRIFVSVKWQTVVYYVDPEDENETGLRKLGFWPKF